MPRIGLVDDNEEKRGSVATTLGLHLPEAWQIVSEPPLNRASDYPCWLRDNEIAVLLLDWRLDDSPRNDSRAVTYQADAIVDVVRRTRPTFPIFVITAYLEDENLKLRAKDIDHHMSREPLTEAPEIHVQRMIRAGTRFWKQHRDDLARMSDLAAKVARGTASRQEQGELKALRTGLGLAFSVEDVESQAERLAEADKFRRKGDAVRQRIEDFLTNEQPE